MAMAIQSLNEYVNGIDIKTLWYPFTNYFIGKQLIAYESRLITGRTISVIEIISILIELVNILIAF